MPSNTENLFMFNDHLCVLFCANVHCALLNFLWFFFFFLLFRAAHKAYGSSQVTGRIGAIAAGLRPSHSNIGSEPRLHPTPLSEARDRTCNLMVPSRIGFHCTVTGTPFYGFFFFNLLLFIRRTLCILNMLSLCLS